MKKSEFKGTASIIIPAMSPSYSGDYLIGGIIALLIMIYLVYALIKPEKF